MKQSASQRFRFTLIIILASLCFATVTLAQSSANFDLSWYGMANGGGQRSSANFVVQDATGQVFADTVNSAAFRIEGGFVPGLATNGAANASPTPTVPPPQAGGDAFEDDDVCVRAHAIPTDGGTQDHTFHDTGDSDWLRFTAQANKTYIIRVQNGNKADAGIALFDACNLTPADFGNNSFGTETVLTWDSTKNGDYFIQLQQQTDPPTFGDDVTYKVSVTVDNVPPSTPANTRCVAENATTLNVQWQKSPERDVKQYIVQYTGGPLSANANAPGANTTFTQIGGLTSGQTYNLTVRAEDFSGNFSTPSPALPCTPQTPADTTQPALSLESPLSDTVKTASNAVSFVGSATDAGNNLSRVQVRNTTTGATGWDYGLSGSSHIFRVENLSMAIGDNTIQVTAYDAAGNQSTPRNLTVNRQGNVKGAVLIIAGRNEGNSLQSNIINSANRAYRIFKTAGFSDDGIFYIAPSAQDADNNGTPDVDATPSSATAIQNALTTWAAGKVGPGQPLFVYMVDHGLVDQFCLDGCNTNAVTPADLNGWLNTLESTTGVDQVNVVIEACLSGSFITRNGGADLNTLSKPGRVIVTSTSDNKNAYASADGAYFSDAFFSCAADSQDIKTCFDQAKAAVSATGVSQAPQLDDNGDAVFNAGDGAVAQTRFVTRFFGSLRPTITSYNVARQGANGVLTAQVTEGAEAINLVWAAIYPPSFTEPVNVTLNLNVPTVQLQPDPDTPGKYTFTYTNGFIEEGKYRVVFYAQDKSGIHAIPQGDFGGSSGSKIYLPVVRR